LSEIKIAAIAIVKEYSVGAPILQSSVKRDGLIDRIAAFGIAGGVGIPINKGTATLIETSSFFSQSVKVFVEAQLLRSRDERARLRIKHQIFHQGFRVIGHRLFVCIDNAM